MKYAIISDIHANLTALKRVIADALSQGVEKFVCLGDIVGYGPQRDETLDCVRALSGYVIAGNHDDAVSGRGMLRHLLIWRLMLLNAIARV
jgi:predicted phosphodiesterase